MRTSADSVLDIPREASLKRRIQLSKRVVAGGTRNFSNFHRAHPFANLMQHEPQLKRANQPLCRNTLQIIRVRDTSEPSFAIKDCKAKLELILNVASASFNSEQRHSFWSLCCDNQTSWEIIIKIRCTLFCRIAVRSLDSLFRALNYSPDEVFSPKREFFFILFKWKVLSGSIGIFITKLVINSRSNLK